MLQDVPDTWRELDPDIDYCGRGMLRATRPSLS
jgi:hypothetical protein